MLLSWHEFCSVLCNKFSLSVSYFQKFERLCNRSTRKYFLSIFIMFNISSPFVWYVNRNIISTPHFFPTHYVYCLILPKFSVLMFLYETIIYQFFYLLYDSYYYKYAPNTILTDLYNKGVCDLDNFHDVFKYLCWKKMKITFIFSYLPLQFTHKHAYKCKDT
jgi:hypothetical protein